MSIEQRSDRDAERSLLAACLESKTAREEARKHIVPRDFDLPAHEAIWDAMTRLDRHGKAVDLTTVAAIVANTGAQAALIDLVGNIGHPDNVATYAGIVRSWATRRRIETAARDVLQKALNPATNPVGLAASVANTFAGIRDHGTTEDDFTAVTLGELLADEDDEPEWLIPGLLERRDRLMLTGEEGLGKSHLLRQFAVHAAAGVHPLDSMTRIDPIRTLIVDCENSWSQVRRKLRGAADWVVREMRLNPDDGLMVDCIPRIDITRDKDLARIHQLLDVWAPDLVVIGPLYRLVPRALQTDDEAAPVLAAIDTIRERGCAVLIEAHAGHAIGKGGLRDLRPRGSSALLGWPEFGFGLRNIGTAGYADFVQWRGPREERAWPQRLRKADGFRWVPHADTYGYDQGGYVA